MSVTRRSAFPILTTLLLACAALVLARGDAAAVEPLIFTTDLNQDGLLEETRVERVDGELRVHDASGRLLARVADAAGEAAPIFVDLDGDGYPDLARGAALLIDGRALNASAAAGDRWFEDEFIEVWDTGDNLLNVWDAEVTDFDGDGLTDVITQSYHYPGGELFIYETTGNNAFDLVWRSEIVSENTITALCVGDTDRDNRKEIVAGEAGFDGNVYMWERDPAEGDGSACIAVPLSIRMGMRVRSIVNCDIDNDGRREYCIAAGESDGGSSIKLIEHSGAPGENVFESPFTCYMHEYILGVVVGDSDNDGRGEMLVLLGGWPGETMAIRRFEYDPGQDAYVWKEFNLGYAAPATSAAIANIDADPENELLIGTENRILVVQATGDDAYAISWIALAGITGNVLDFSVGHDNEFGFPMFAFSTHSGQLCIYGYDLHTYVNHVADPILTGHTVRSIDLGFFDAGDARDDLLVTRSYLERVSLYEPIVLTGLPHEPSAAAGFGLRATRNPFVVDTELRFDLPREMPCRLDIFDARGRLVRRLGGGVAAPGTHVHAWDGRDRDGRELAAGVYLARLRAGAAEATTRLIHLR